MPGNFGTIVGVSTPFSSFRGSRRRLLGRLKPGSVLVGRKAQLEATVDSTFRNARNVGAQRSDSKMGAVVEAHLLSTRFAAQAGSDIALKGG